MKKLLFTLLTAACFAGAASATTIDWGSSLVTDYSTVSKANSFTIVYAFNIADAAELATFSVENVLLSVSTANNERWAALSASSSQQRALYDYSNQTSNFYTVSSKGLNVGGNTIAIIVNRDDTTNNKTTYSWYVNGATYSNSTIKWTNDAYFSTAFTSVTIADSISDGKLFVVDGVLSDSEIATLPEPTALALLALGAAGLALRRKAA